MKLDRLWELFSPFVFTFLLGILATSFINFDSVFRVLSQESVIVAESNGIGEPIQIQNKGSRRGRGSSGGDSASDCFAFNDGKCVTGLKPGKSFEPYVGVKFLSKPQPQYSKEARLSLFEGSIVFRITFLANGQIGNISPASELLPFGLTEQAVEAARKIEFVPAMRNGKRISITKSIKYTFTIY